MFLGLNNQMSTFAITEANLKNIKTSLRISDIGFTSFFKI